jgi:hypothetical protein
VYSSQKSLLVRADFVLGTPSGEARLSYKRWRRFLADILPRLLGCAQRCPKAVVRLHQGEGEAYYTGWLRLPIRRRVSRKRLRLFRAQLRARLEAGLLPIGGRVLRLGIQRRVPHPAEPVILALPNAGMPASGQVTLFDPHSLSMEEPTAASEESPAGYRLQQGCRSDAAGPFAGNFSRDQPRGYTAPLPPPGA